MEIHLTEHEMAAKGTFPQNTLGCDHVGGAHCQYIERRIATATEQAAGTAMTESHRVDIAP